MLINNEIKTKIKITPQFDMVHQKLKIKNMTKKKLWQEYENIYQESAYSFPIFSQRYGRWLRKQKSSIRQSYKGGDNLFVNYVSPNIHVDNPDTGKSHKVIIFIATLGASGYTYIEVFGHNDTESALMANVNALNFFLGTPKTITTYQNSLFGLNHTLFKKNYQAFVEHYNIECKQLKLNVNSKRAEHIAPIALQDITSELLSKIHSEGTCTLFCLEDLLARFSFDLNYDYIESLDGDREERFWLLDYAALTALPKNDYEFFHIKKTTAEFNQHICYKNHYYSIPAIYSEEEEELEIRANARLVSIYNHQHLIAQHKREHEKGGYSTLRGHMPCTLDEDSDSFSEQNLISWANQIGSSTAAIIVHALSVVRYPQHAYLRCFDIIYLSNKYSYELLEYGCNKYQSQLDVNPKNIERTIKYYVRKLHAYSLN
jgi:hypothetical protein